VVWVSTMMGSVAALTWAVGLTGAISAILAGAFSRGFAGQHLAAALRGRDSRHLGRGPTMTRFMMAITAVVLWGCGSAFAQIGGTSILPGLSPLGMTSPLGIGPGSPVAPTNLPLGAMELASPGVSPMTSGASPTGIITTCSGVGGSMPGTSSGAGTSTFDGGGMTGTASGAGGVTGTAPGAGGMTGTTSGACGLTGSSSLAGTAAAASSGGGMGSASSVGRAGIPLGSTELGGGGLSPPSVALTTNPLSSLMTLTPLVVVPNQSVPVSTSGSTTTCQTTGTGVPSATGVTTPFGAPLTGNALSLAGTPC
jgi:hypothetical protein